MARTVRRSPSRGGESKTGLIIALVFLVLTVITLGVFTYLGYSGQTALEDKAKKAEKAEQAAKKAARRAELQTLLVKTAAGYAQTAAGADQQSDAEKLTILRGQFERKDQDFQGMTEKEAQEIRDLDTRLKKDTSDDPIKQKKTLVQQLAAVRAELETVKADLESQRATAAQTKNSLDDEIKRLQTVLKQKDVDLKTAQDEIANAKAERPKQVTDVETRWQKVNQENEKLKRDIENLKKDLDDKDKAYQDMEAKWKTEVDKRRIREAAQTVATKTTNMLQYQQPWGKIVRLDRTGQMAYIDLGSADNARAQLTFSVAGRGLDGRPKSERKGSLEIIRVIDRKLSLAKITNVVDPFNDPVVPGDALFNPAWNPTQKEHVAIAGRIDLNGDGSDNTAEFIRHLERQGIVVDAYLDLKGEPAIKPSADAITSQTHYLIVGDQPKFDGLVQEKDNPRAKAKEAIVTKMGEMSTKAKDEGVNIIGYRDFMTMIGYPKRQSISMSGTPETLQGRDKGGEEAGAKEDKPKEDQPPADDNKKPAGDKKKDKDKNDDK